MILKQVGITFNCVIRYDCRPKIYPCILAVIRLTLTSAMMVLSHVSWAQTHQRLGVTYEATIQQVSGLSTSIYYDKGKYAILSESRIRIYDGINPLIKWLLDVTMRTAYLDFDYKLKLLFSILQKQGVEATAQQSGIDLSVLKRFARIYKPYTPRNFDYTLQIVVPSLPTFSKSYKKVGVEKIAGWSCDVYCSKMASNNRLWVEPASGCVLKMLEVTISDDPRKPPSRYERQVAQFRLVSSISPTRFIVPAGYTAVLPRILRDFPLPIGVKRKLMTGRNSFLGDDLERIVDTWEANLRQQAEYKKKRAELLKARRR